jgi:hypothetical protein
LVILPVVSEVVTVNENEAGAANTEPLLGFAKATAGGTFVA